MFPVSLNCLMALHTVATLRLQYISTSQYFATPHSKCYTCTLSKWLAGHTFYSYWPFSTAELRIHYYAHGLLIYALSKLAQCRSCTLYYIAGETSEKSCDVGKGQEAILAIATCNHHGYQPCIIFLIYSGIGNRVVSLMVYTKYFLFLRFFAWCSRSRIERWRQGGGGIIVIMHSNLLVLVMFLSCV